MTEGSALTLWEMKGFWGHWVTAKKRKLLLPYFLILDGTEIGRLRNSFFLLGGCFLGGRKQRNKWMEKQNTAH